MDSKESIYEKKVVEYMNKVWTGLFICLTYVTVSEVFMFLMIKYFHFVDDSGLFLSGRWIPDFAYFKRHIILPVIINWSACFFFKHLYHLVPSFNLKKWTIIASYLFICTVYTFGHWGFIFLSVYYTIPIMITCPLGKKEHLIVTGISLLGLFAYALYQNFLIPSTYHYLVMSMALAVIAAAYLSSRTIYSLFMSMITDVQRATALNNDLYQQSIHDSLTKVYNRSALFRENKDYFLNFKSMAFVDVDDFKGINDRFGHLMGDNVLIFLAETLKNNAFDIYRYGGDEFVLTSYYEKKELKDILAEIQKKFETESEKKFGFKSTVSIGIIGAKQNDSLANLLKNSDTLMYKSKKNGKNIISVE